MNAKREIRDAKTRFEVKNVPRVEIKRIRNRGDEVAILFFSLVFLIFLFISFFRLFAIGKLFDDFIFLFLFGWTKYLVYFVLFSIVLPLCFNYYVKLKWSFGFAMFFSFIAVSWVVANVILIVINSFNSDVSIWGKINFYDFNHLKNYFQTWWKNTIINNYHGFFGQPLSFNSWTNISSFFPPYASGGIIANALVAICNHGYFIINWILSLVVLFIAFSWLLFGKPWFLFIGIFVLFKLLKTYFKKRKNKPSEKISQRKEVLDPRKTNDQRNSFLLDFNQDRLNNENSSKSGPRGIAEKYSKKTENKQNTSMQDIIQESGTLTPFGQLNRELDEKIYENLKRKLDELNNNEDSKN